MFPLAVAAVGVASSPQVNVPAPLFAAVSVQNLFQFGSAPAVDPMMRILSVVTNGCPVQPVAFTVAPVCVRLAVDGMGVPVDPAARA